MSGRPTRSIVRLRSDEARAYARSVAAATPFIEAALGPGVLANRAVGRGRIATARLEPWRPGRERWNSAMRAHDGGVALVTDVRDCYGSIGPERVEPALRRAGVSTAIRRPIIASVEGFAEAGIHGLPVGPAPSAIIANAVLLELDDTLATLRLRYVRWVDDIVVFARRPPEAERALRALEETLAASGGALHDGKTSIVEVAPRARPTWRSNSLSEASDMA